MKDRLFQFCTALALWMSLAAAAAAETVVLAVPGPGTLSYLPVYLAKALAADRAEGIDLKLRYFSGGPLAMRDLTDNNSDFLAIGLPAIAAGRAAGKPVVAIGQLSQAAMYVFLLRRNLKDRVHSIAQLRGKRIGTTSGTISEHSMGYMMAEYLTRRAGLKPGEVQFIPAGQNRADQGAALASASVDALVGDEPFASELVDHRVAVRLVDLYQPEQSRKQFGGPIVHAALATREDVYAQHPDTVKRVQRMFDRTLHWLATHSASAVADKLDGQPGFDPARRGTLVSILQHDRGMFTGAIAWDQAAIATTEDFFHREADKPAESDLSFGSFIRN
jgi:NitT/TauT family transport system substrate-binding protein